MLWCQILIFPCGIVRALPWPSSNFFVTDKSKVCCNPYLVLREATQIRESGMASGSSLNVHEKGKLIN